MDFDERLMSADLKDEDKALDFSLRPRRFAEFIGREKIKENLSVFIEAARMRNEALDHVLLYGPPGLGTVSYTHLRAHET